ncbi:hypothetical protein ADEAN_000597600 [Angomonas deanei]|uniref:Uncharacterized protein n=1 Tax=Angomonas deanei TaxID=59799 RepID=A0A7G2CHE9_9TRYP|nr:hypothetical protein ADEAN_000597600 [Angomonas deanei]
MIHNKVAYIVRCNDCGYARKTYNDIRGAHATVSCNVCNTTHSDWSLVREIDPQLEWPLPTHPSGDNESVYAIPEHIPLSEEQLAKRHYEAAHAGGVPLAEGLDYDEHGGVDPSEGHTPFAEEMKYCFVSCGSGSVARGASVDRHKKITA